MTRLDLQRDGDDRSPNGRVHWQFVAWLLGVVVSVLMTYNATAASYDKRITVLEERYDRVQKDLEEIKNDVKVLVRRP